MGFLKQIDGRVEKFTFTDIVADIMNFWFGMKISLTKIDIFESISKMLDSTWLGRTLSSGTHMKTIFSKIKLIKVCLIAENKCLVVLHFKVARWCFRLLNTFIQNDGTNLLHMQTWERGGQTYFLIINGGVRLKSVSVHRLTFWWWHKNWGQHFLYKMSWITN